MSATPGFFVMQFFMFAFPLSLMVAILFPVMTHALSRMAQAVLAPYFPPDTLTVVQNPFLNRTAFFLALPSVHPSKLFAAVNAVVSLIILFMLPRLRHAKHVFIFLVVVFFINIVSSLFFTFFPERFPYQASDYSELYIKQQVGIWFFAPLIMGLAILPLPASALSKLATLGAAFCYSLVFGTIRYIAFLFILTKATLLCMAILFFVFGPLVDFIYIVGIYSVYVTRLAKKLKGDFTTWKWLY